MGKNKLQKFEEMQTFHNVFQYPFATLKENSFNLKGNWNAQFFKNTNPVILELGCGKGEYTVGLAKQYPEKNFIGIDIKGARMWHGAKQALHSNLDNAAFLRTHIELLEHFFAPSEISEIWLTFPDPQMNKTGKRMTSARFISLYGKILTQNGIIHLKTDSPFLFAYTCEMIKLNDFPVLVSTDDLYGSDTADEILSIKTFYEQQWLSRNMKIKYLRFILKQREKYSEPETEFERDDYRSFGRHR
ncbi:MAG: tRNA (guanosine(46)-N7)-methyltransferase TrmB [Dysgonamonadaceae bacterium]|jgi:tRNA (guanine-N7-)-methyltransferase|nr:tRNA (guanosine(46)-N7)-methyltransferase TrmB [Dysgonamonadaceae bacterium]